jgi:hypothetical protein
VKLQTLCPNFQNATMVESHPVFVRVEGRYKTDCRCGLPKTRHLLCQNTCQWTGRINAWPSVLKLSQTNHCNDYILIRSFCRLDAIERINSDRLDRSDKDE